MNAAENAIVLQRMIAHNDEQALKQLFDAYYSGLFRFAYSLLHNRPVAEEIVEDIFIKLWEKRTELPAIINLFAYLFTAVRNSVLNYQQLVKNQSYIDIEDVQITLITSMSDPEAQLVSKQGLRQIDDAIAALPPQCRLIFQLVKEHGLKYREVADLLQLSIKTIEAQMGLALRKVSETLLKSGVIAEAIHGRKK